MRPCIALEQSKAVATTLEQTEAIDRRFLRHPIADEYRKKAHFLVMKGFIRGETNNS